MASIEITAIERLPIPGTSPLAWGVDLPRIGERSDGYALTVAGWVFGRGHAVATVEVLHEGHRLTGIPVLLVRPDVTKHLELPDPIQPTGFEVSFNAVGLPESFEIALWAYFADGATVEFARIRGIRTPLQSAFRPALQPLSVTSLGRTGTTMIMGMLAEHPDICVHRVFPFETRIAAYWMHVLTVLGGPANLWASSHPDRFLSDRLFVGNNPYARAAPRSGPALEAWFRGEAVEELAAFCQRNVDAAYLRIARDQEEPGGRFFAEKNVPTYVPRLLRQVYTSARELILVRDIRDVICSMLSFDSQRGARDFLRDASDNDAFILRIVEGFRGLVTAWLERRESALLLRYEDLVADPVGQLRRITAHVGLDGSPSVLERMAAAGGADSEETRAHRTTRSAALSIGRHRRDMDSRTADFCLEAAGELLRTVGYAV